MDIPELGLTEGEEQELVRNLQDPCRELCAALKDWEISRSEQASQAIAVAHTRVSETLMQFHSKHPHASYYFGTSPVLSDQIESLGVDVGDKEWLRIDLDITRLLAEGFRKRIQGLLGL